jgi:hypothetical protein
MGVIVHVGIGCIGFVFGYLLYYAVRHTDKFDVTMLSAAIGAVGGEVVIAWVGKGDPNWIGSYGIGLFVGFVAYFLLTVYYFSKGTLDKMTEFKVLTLLGTDVKKAGK